MSKTLPEVAQQLKDAGKKVQLIYAFNGIGKTRLSRAFKQLIAPRVDEIEGEDAENQIGLSRNKILYYNALTEDLFYWDNDLAGDVEHKLRIQPNSFTDWVLKDQGQDQNIITTFQRYTSDKLTPRFNAVRTEIVEGEKEITIKAFSEVTFSMESGDDARFGKVAQQVEVDARDLADAAQVDGRAVVGGNPDGNGTMGGRRSITKPQPLASFASTECGNASVHAT